MIIWDILCIYIALQETRQTSTHDVLTKMHHYKQQALLEPNEKHNCSERSPINSGPLSFIIFFPGFIHLCTFILDSTCQAYRLLPFIGENNRTSASFI